MNGCGGSHTRGQDLSVPAEPEGVDGVCVAFQFSNHDSVADVPEENSAVSGSRGQEFPVGGEHQCMDGSLEEKKAQCVSPLSAALKYKHETPLKGPSEMLTDLTLWPVKMRTQFPLRTSQRRMVRSDEPVAT